MCFKVVFFNEKKSEGFGWFLMKKIYLEIQILALFDSSPLHQFSKFNDFLCVCWLGKKFSNFLLPPLENLTTYITIVTIWNVR